MSTVKGYGPTTARWAIVGEAPGAEEQRQGKPFVGPSGQLLRESLERVGLDPNEAYITNVYQEYRYGNPTPSKDEIEAARSELIAELQALPQLEAVLLVGNVPLQAVTGLSGITNQRGTHEVVEGTDEQGGGQPVWRPFATLHPAAVLRNQRWKSGWLNDLAAFAALLDGIEEQVEVIHVARPEDVQLVRKAGEAAGWVGALDVETTIGDVFVPGSVQLVCVGVSFDGKTSYVVYHDDPVFHKVLLLLSRGEWIMHNGSFDLLILEELSGFWGWKLKGDTMAMAYLIHPEERKSLQLLSGVYLKLPPYKDVQYKDILSEPVEKVVLMNGRDVARTYLLYRPLADELNQNSHLSRTYQWLLLPAISALVQITRNGVPVDAGRLEELSEAVREEEAELLAELQALTPPPGRTYGKPDWPKGGFNPRSPQQVANVIFDVKRYPVLKRNKKTDSPSTDKSVLSKLAEDHPEDEWLAKLMQYRKVTKLLTAYINAWPKYIVDGSMHPRYKPTQVVTGRLSSEMPNIQQVPRKDARVKRVFGGRQGMVWVRADLSQIELRIAAWIAGEEAMLEAFRAGDDLHSLTAQKILGDPSARQVGKTLNFGLLYGAYPGKLIEVARNDYGVTLTKREAEKYRAAFFDTYPGLVEWHDRVKSELAATQMVASPLGRVRHFPEVTIDADEWEVRAAEREAVNHPVQSFASDMLLHALVTLPQEVQAWAIAEVHDEIDFFMPHGRVEEYSAVIQETMEDTSWLRKWGIEFNVPVLAEVTHGPYWSE